MASDKAGGPGQPEKYDEANCRDYLVYKLGPDITRVWRYEQGIHEVQKRLQLRYGDESLAEAMKIFWELLEMDDIASGHGGDGDPWRSWRHDHKLMRGDPHKSGKPGIHGDVRPVASGSGRMHLSVPSRDGGHTEVPVEQAANEEPVTGSVGVQVEPSRSAHGLPLSAGHGGSRDQEMTEQQQREYHDSLKAETTAYEEAWTRVGLSLGQRVSVKVSRIFRRVRKWSRRSGLRARLGYHNRGRHTGTSLKVLVGSRARSDGGSVSDDISGGYKAPSSTHLPQQTQPFLTLNLDGTDEPDHLSYTVEEHDSRSVDDLRQPLSPLARYLQNTAHQHESEDSRYLSPLARFVNNTFQPHEAQVAQNPSLDLLTESGFSTITSNRDSQDSWLDLPSTPRMPSRELLERLMEWGTGPRRGAMEAGGNDPGEGRPAHTRNSRWSIFSALDLGSRRSTVYSEHAAAGENTESSGAAGRPAHLRHLDNFPEEVEQNEPTTPTGRPRSPHKKLFGQHGWLGRGPSTQSAADLPKSVSLKDLRDKLRRRVGDLSGDMGRRLSRQVNHLAGSTDIMTREAALVARRPISIDREDQSALYSHFELAILVTANDFLMHSRANERLSRESVQNAIKAWCEKARPLVVEFQFDQATQRAIIMANKATVKFRGRSHEDSVAVERVLYNWGVLIKETAARSFCLPDTLVRKHIEDGCAILELLGATEQVATSTKEVVDRILGLLRKGQELRDSVAAPGVRTDWRQSVPDLSLPVPAPAVTTSTVTRPAQGGFDMHPGAQVTYLHAPGRVPYTDLGYGGQEAGPSHEA